MRSPILAGNRILSFMPSVGYIADVYMYECPVVLGI